jgi:hypothetical protein
MPESPVYAKNTKVTAEKSEREIRETLKKFGATAYSYYEDQQRIGFVFEYEKRRVRIVIDLPDPAADEFVSIQRGFNGKQTRSEADQLKAWQKECDRRWRALVLTIRSKLVSVTEKIRTFEQEFLYDIVLPNGQTVGEYVAPQLQQSLGAGKMPPLLPGVSER